MIEKDVVSLICPHDRYPLEKDVEMEMFFCGHCARRFPITESVIRLLEDENHFYEGSFKNQVKFLPRCERWYAVWPLWLLNSGYVWKVRRYFPPGSILLELGCAGGIAYFGQRYTMIGLDVSYSSLADAAKLYRYNLQAEAFPIPLPDASVDGVVSSNFWEHIPPDKKPALLMEIHRVLRPGGKLVFLYDVETRNPFISWMIKKDKKLYRELFIEADGHLGYESERRNRELFVHANFTVLEHFGMERTMIQSPSVFVKLGKWRGLPGLMGKVMARLGRSPLFYGYTLLIRVIDQSIGWLLPGSWARITISVCAKQ